MEKENLNEQMSAKGIMINGIECITQNQAAQMAGVSLPTFRKKVKLFNIERVQWSNRSLYRKQDILTAIGNNWFAKWWV